MNKKRWFVCALVFLFAATLAGYANAQTGVSACPPSSYVIERVGSAVPSNINVFEQAPITWTPERGTVFTIEMWTTAGFTDLNYRNVWVPGAGGFNALFPLWGIVPTGFQDANGNGKSDVYDLAKAVDPNVAAGYLFGQPVAVPNANGGFKSPFDVVVDEIDLFGTGASMEAIVIRQTTTLSGQMQIPFDAVRFFSLNLNDVIVDNVADLMADVAWDEFANVRRESVKIATIISSDQVFGGIGQPASTEERVFETDDTIQVKLKMLPPAGVENAQLYVLLQITDTTIDEAEPFVGLSFFRPDDALVPLNAGRYLVLAATPDGGFLPDTGKWIYAVYPGVADEAIFNIRLSGMAGGTFKVWSAYKTEDQEDLNVLDSQVIQSVTFEVIK